MGERFRVDWPTWRPLAIGRRGAVASGHPQASLAGLDVLRAGGNAADAAVTVATTLGVVEPAMSGVGGDGFYLYYSAREQRGWVVNATGPAPRAATRDRYPNGIPPLGVMTASVPGAVDGWLTLHERFGTRPRREVFQRAIEIAREGFGVTRRYLAFTDQPSIEAMARDPRASVTYLRDGRPPEVGDWLTMLDLARTLEAIAEGGRDAFYGGEIGRRLADFCQANGGLIAREDMAEYRCEVQDPIGIDYRGYRVLEAPPNSTGFTLLQELKVAEQFDLQALGLLSADLVHTLVEIKKLAFEDRERHCADPRFVDVPLDELLSEAHARKLAAQIDPKRAASRPSPWARSTAGVAGDGNTTYFCVVDGEGNAVSGIQSINGLFGSCVVAGDTGILLNNRMRYWHLYPDHPNALEPGKRVRHTMNPPLVLKDGEVYLVQGTPGADAQVQTNLQVITAILDFGLDPQQAVEMPRWRSYQPGMEANWPHTISDHLVVEDRFPAEVRAELERRGHTLDVVGPLEGGCNAQAILRLPESGALLAGSDPRRDAAALAF